MPFVLLGRVGAFDHSARPLPIKGNKARALLALLLIRANCHVFTDQIEDELWDGDAPPSARGIVHAHVSRLRAVLAAMDGAASLTGGAGGYVLRVDPQDVDLRRFEVLAAAAGRVLERDPRQAADLCARALEEWRGEALQDVRDVSSLYLEGQRLDELRLATIEIRMAAELEAGGHVMVAGPLQRLVAEHPYREQLRGLSMLALHRSGRQTEALRCYRDGYAALAEIGVRPSGQLRALAESISADDPSLQRPASGDAGAGVTVTPAPTRDEWTAIVERERRIVLFEGAGAPDAVRGLVATAQRTGRCVLSGRGRSGMLRPYQAVADALVPLLTGTVDAGLRRALAPIVDAVPPAQGADPPYQRFRAFEAAASLLHLRAATGPVLLIVQDVDHAGPSTLDLLEHAVRHRGEAPIAIVISRTTTTSETNLDPVLVRLERDGLVRRIELPSDGGTTTQQGGHDGPSTTSLDHAVRAADAFAQASTLSARAGDDALLRFGFAEAVTHYRAALTAIDLTPAPHRLRRAELQLALGHACHAAYHLDDALVVFRHAATHAAELGDLHLLVEAAVGVATTTEFGMADEQIEAVLVGALKVVPEEHPATVELLAGLGRTLPRHDPAAFGAARRAVRLARRLDVPRPLTIALATSVLVMWAPGGARQRIVDIDEVIARATGLEMVELAIEARGWRAATLRQLGRDDEAEVDTAIVLRWAEQSRRPFFLALASMLTIDAHLRHRRADAAEAALADLPTGADASPNFSAAFAAQLFLLRRLQGRIAEFVPLFEMLANDHRAPAAWDAARVLALAETGDSSSRAQLHAAVRRLPSIPEDWLWLTAVALLSDACIRLCDHEAAFDLRSRLWPHRDEVVVVAHGIASLGPVMPRLEALQTLLPLDDPRRATDRTDRRLRRHG